MKTEIKIFNGRNYEEKDECRAVSTYPDEKRECIIYTPLNKILLSTGH